MVEAYKPAQQRALRAQGRRTRARLANAGLAVFADRGYHAARVDDIVRRARASHGTFYLYFTNKEDLLGALAIECAQAYEALAATIADAESVAPIDECVEQFFAIYARYGPVIRAWMENAVADREINRLGVVAFRHIAAAFAGRLRAEGRPHDAATVGSLMALLERSAYYAGRDPTRPGDARTVARIVQNGYFGAGAFTP